MIYTVKCLTHVQQNHSREFLLIHASQNGICGADKCRFCGIKFLISITRNLITWSSESTGKDQMPNQWQF